MSNPLTAQYFDSGGRVAFMACAMFALGLIVGALIMDWAHERARKAARKPRPARVRPVEPPRPAARHRATRGGVTPVDSGLAAGRPTRMPTSGTTSGAGQARARIDVRA